MKLPKLPPLNPAGPRKPRVRLPGLPDAPHEEDGPKLYYPDELKPADNPTWGQGPGVGRWYEGEDGSIGGTCVNCGVNTAARNLRYHVQTWPPGSGWEGWACIVCRKGGKGMERTMNAPKLNRDTASRTTGPVAPKTNKIYEPWYLIDQMIRDWENEGGAV